jgi:hypothetical protein
MSIFDAMDRVTPEPQFVSTNQNLQSRRKRARTAGNGDNNDNDNSSSDEDEDEERSTVGMATAPLLTTTSSTPAPATSLGGNANFLQFARALARHNDFNIEQTRLVEQFAQVRFFRLDVKHKLTVQ